MFLCDIDSLKKIEYFDIGKKLIYFFEDYIEKEWNYDQEDSRMLYKLI